MKLAGIQESHNILDELNKKIKVSSDQIAGNQDAHKTWYAKKLVRFEQIV